ncbi:MAG: helix-turn-helix domain-containing protein [Oscillospiraceae bacterium]|jgi:transcriptional regulator with XRE-family HTH domain|nr:helix-turn-helix domain-containing protein [Oscillospiraceae bacterium]
MKIYDYNGKKNLCGERIREARKKKKLSQADFAAQLQIEGVTIERDCISRIEIGTRFVADYELLIVSRVLGVTVDWLLSGI